MEDFEGVVADVVLVSSLNIMDSDQQTIIHDVESRQQFNIPFGLLHKQVSFLWSQLQLPIPVDPIEILLCCTRVVGKLFVADGTSKSRALQVIGFVDVPVGGEDIAHDHEMNLASVRQLDTMKSKESA